MPRTLFLALFAVALLVLASSADAVTIPVHRYSFTSDVSDTGSDGTAHGTVVDAGTTANASFSGGMLDLTANEGNPSNNITEDAYVDLPNNIFSSAVSGGTAGAATIEGWYTLETQRTWQWLATFGTSNDGEDTSNSGLNSQYVMATPSSGRFNQGLETTNHPSSNAADPALGGSTEPNVGVAGPSPTGVQQHVLIRYDTSDDNGGLFPNGTMSFWVNGELAGRNGIHAEVDLADPIDNNNWLGRSQWGDPIFDGSYDEFRMYDFAVNDGHAYAAYAQFGPDKLVPEPASAALVTVMGGILLTLARRKRR